MPELGKRTRSRNTCCSSLSVHQRRSIAVEEPGVEEAEAVCAPTRTTAEWVEGAEAEAEARWSSSSLSQSVVHG